ncbi:DUF3265 domain-containing protein [Vibrio parahaemolyticus]|nr:DUF3265 domain-containing protein [Vibrio parahaemolyticus]EGR3318989.1 DUF3265 domain-containing protein [Vibrio parahaemolyticus]TOL90961.1 DUF3265 domain-containing protein [Vibrio parahaemolyticus]
MIIASHCFCVQRCRTSYLNPRQLTKHSRGIRNAWHFYYALRLVVKVVCGSIGIALLTP